MLEGKPSPIGPSHIHRIDTLADSSSHLVVIYPSAGTAVRVEIHLRLTNKTLGAPRWMDGMVPSIQCRNVRETPRSKGRPGQEFITVASKVSCSGRIGPGPGNIGSKRRALAVATETL